MTRNAAPARTPADQVRGMRRIVMEAGAGREGRDRRCGPLLVAQRARAAHPHRAPKRHVQRGRVTPIMSTIANVIVTG